MAVTCCPEPNRVRSEATQIVIDACIREITIELRLQYDLAKCLDSGPLKRTTLNLLESSLYTYRWISAKGGHRHHV